MTKTKKLKASDEPQVYLVRVKWDYEGYNGDEHVESATYAVMASDETEAFNKVQIKHGEESVESIGVLACYPLLS